MQCAYRNLFAALSLMLLAVALSPAAFINDDTSGMDVLVDFDDLPTSQYGSELTDAPVEVYSDGLLTINMAASNYNTNATPVRYGLNMLMLDGVGTDAYLRTPDADGFDPGEQMGIEFQITGGAVSAIGIHLSTVDALLGTLTDVTLAIYDGDGVELESFTITDSSTPVDLGSLQAPSNDPSLGGFYGFSTGSNNIVSFRITGGFLVLDDLRLRTLEDEGPGGPGGEDPPPDPAAVPEPRTLLLCGGVLGLLAIARRYRVLPSA